MNPSQNMPRQKDPRGFLTVVVITQMLGFASLVLSPLLIGGLIAERGFSADQAGIFTTIGLVGLAIGSLTASSFVNRLPRRLATLLAAIACCVCYLGMSLALPLPLLIAFQFIAGLAAGAVLSIMTAVGATSCDPEKLFGEVAMFTSLLGAALIYLGGLASAKLGLIGVMVVEAGLAFTAMVIILMTPRATMELPETADHLPIKEPSAPMTHVAAVVGCAFLMWMAWLALWSFAEQIGRLSGLTVDKIGLVLGAATFFGAGCAIASVWVVRRKGRTFSMLTFCVLNILAGVLFLYPHWLPFALAGLLWGGMNYFLAPVLFGIAASLGNGGKWAGVTASFNLIGSASGPAVAGLLASRYGMDAPIWMGIALTIAGTIIILPISRWADRTHAVRHSSHPDEAMELAAEAPSPSA